MINMENREEIKIQIGDTIEYTIDNKNTTHLHGKTFRVEVASIDENNCYVYAPYGQDIVPIEQAKLVYSKQPKQVDGEIEAVEFLEWTLSSGFKLNPHCEQNRWNHIDRINSNNPILDDGFTTKQLYEIFKNRK